MNNCVVRVFAPAVAYEIVFTRLDIRTGSMEKTKREWIDREAFDLANRLESVSSKWYFAQDFRWSRIAERNWERRGRRPMEPNRIANWWYRRDGSHRAAPNFASRWWWSIDCLGWCSYRNECNRSLDKQHRFDESRESQWPMKANNTWTYCDEHTRQMKSDVSLPACLLLLLHLTLQFIWFDSALSSIVYLWPNIDPTMKIFSFLTIVSIEVLSRHFNDWQSEERENETKWNLRCFVWMTERNY